MSADVLLLQIRTSYLHFDIRANEPQLGQFYMAEFAERAGYTVKIKRYASHEPIIANLRIIINELRPSVLGVYVDSENVWTIRRLFCILKEEYPNIITVIGGPQVTGNPEKAMTLIPMADFGIIGDGEEALVELLNELLHKGANKINVDNICNLIYRNKDGAFGHTKTKTHPNLDFYPFPRRGKYALDTYSQYDQIITGRGCIGQCAFCFEGSKKSNPLRWRSIESIIEEIDYLIDTYPNQRFISFLDDTFIIDRKRVEALCSHLLKNYPDKIGWFCEARADILKRNLDILKVLKEAGCIRLQLGGESGSQRVLDSYKKGVLLDDLRLVVEEIHKSQIPSVYVNFIIGGAFETEQTFNETLSFAKELIDVAPGTVEVGASIFSPYVGTPITNNPMQYGLSIHDENLITGPDGFMPYCSTKELSGPAILQLYNKFGSEIRQHIRSHIVRLNNDILKRHYDLYAKYELSTMWREYSQVIESYNNYYEAISWNGFITYDEICDFSNYLLIPYRTCQPLSDGTKYLKNIAGRAVPFDSTLEERVYLLSTGKLTYMEIISVLINSGYIDATGEPLIRKIYKDFDKHRLIIWRDSM